MFDKNQALMPALLTALLLSLVTIASAQEHAALEDLNDTEQPFVQTQFFSATDDHSLYVVDTCTQPQGATAVLADDPLWKHAADGEIVMVEGQGTEATVIHFAEMASFIDPAIPCCMCVLTHNGMGCWVGGSQCCCRQDISSDLSLTECWCYGGVSCNEVDSRLSRQSPSAAAA